MSTYQRLKRTMRSPVRQARRNTPHKLRRRAVIEAEGWAASGLGEGQSLARIRDARNLLVLHPRNVLDEVYLDRWSRR